MLGSRRRTLGAFGAGSVVAFVAARRSGRRPGRAVIAAVDRVAPGVQPRMQKLFWRAIYALWNRQDAGTAFMNYGYAPLDGPAAGAPDADYGTALYDCVAAGGDLSGKDVLEVGSGRGGGAAFVFETRTPASMVGVDLSKANVDYAGKQFGRPGLRFVQGDAENLPFADASFDAVLNVESAHCYPDVPRFLEEVHRVLRPGGALLLADLRFTDLMQDTGGGSPVAFDWLDVFLRQIDESPFTIAEQEDITPNVRRALQLDSPRRREQVEREVPKRWQGLALLTAGVEGTAFYDDMMSGKYAYLRFVLRKAGELETAGVAASAAADGD